MVVCMSCKGITFTKSRGVVRAHEDGTKTTLSLIPRGAALISNAAADSEILRGIG